MDLQDGMNIHQHGMVAQGTLDHLAAVGNLPKQERGGDGNTVVVFLRDIVLLLAQEYIAFDLASHTRLKTSVGSKKA
jgi:hypothetical protein